MAKRSAFLSFSNEQTFIMCKPDALNRGLTGEIIKRFEQRGFKLVSSKVITASRDLMENHYDNKRTESYFDELISYMTSAPVLAMIWEGYNVIIESRTLIGANQPIPGTIRGDFSTAINRNLIHASDSFENAKREIELWFPMTRTPILKYVKLSEDAFEPIKGSAQAAGYDLKSPHDYILPGTGKILIYTDLKIELPSGCYGRISARSGLAVKKSINVGAGVIDQDYRGNVGVILFNHGQEDFEIKRGDRIAQLICERIYYPILQEVIELNDTTRGANGFGSTGLK